MKFPLYHQGMHFIHIGILASLSMLCAILFAEASEDPMTEKSWREISTGSNSGIEEAAQIVIQDHKAWSEWWKRHTANVFDSAQPDGIKPPNIDFERETVLAVTLGMRSTGGHAVRFAKIHHDGDTLVATLSVQSPGPDDMVTMALTYPFAVIAIPKHPGDIKFITQ